MIKLRKWWDAVFSTKEANPNEIDIIPITDDLERELDRIYDWEDMFDDPNAMDYINEVLDETDVHKVDATLIAAYIIVTRPVTHMLPARKPLIARFHKKYPRYSNII